MLLRRPLFLATLLLILSVALPAAAAGPEAAARKPSPLLSALEAELERTMAELRTRPQPPYFLAYAVYETKAAHVTAAFGAITDKQEQRRRVLTIDLRVGDYGLDNTHPIRGGYGGPLRSRFRQGVDLPLEDDPDALRAVIWRATDRRYREAVQALARVRSNRQVKVEEEDLSDDFSREEAALFSEPPEELEVDLSRWAARVKRWSAVFAGDPSTLEGRASFTAQTTRRTLVSSEGTRIETSRASATVILDAKTKAADGMDLPRHESFFAFRPEELPGEKAILKEARRIARDLAALREAPQLEPYTGPAILRGRSAGVFFHEIFGHRIEGHRLKEEEDSQTFKEMIGQQVLPGFIDVVFDPTRERIGPVPVSGHYRYDDQGVPARPVRTVEKGVLRGFLMSRSPIEGFPRSNGHGRASPGLPPVGRQSNLIVESAETVPAKDLRKMLLEEVRRQEKPFGLLFEEIAGGFTFTGRGNPNAFTVDPIKVWRVYADGRPDELVRGADLIGTPLTAFSRILAAGDDMETFNGVCGAESGRVPVSATSPSLLIGQIEVQKKEKSSERLPILPAATAKAASQVEIRPGEIREDPIFRAVKAELDRARASLTLEGNPPPYFVSASVTDLESSRVQGIFGAISDSYDSFERILNVTVRVGDRKLDNSRFFSMSGFGSRFISVDIPEEDDEVEVRRALWLTLDGAYKDAVEDLARKRAVLESQSRSRKEDLPDFTREEPATVIVPEPGGSFDRSTWEERVRVMSALFRSYPAIHASSVSAAWSRSTKRYLDTDGGVARQTKAMWALQGWASTQAEDGMPLRDFAASFGRPPEEPDPAAFTRDLKALAARLAARRTAPALDAPAWAPVLLEDQAAAEFFLALAGRGAALQRDPVYEDPSFGAAVRGGRGPWHGRIKARVAPEFIDIQDDPTLSTYQGKSLFGSYVVDEEGIPAQPVKLVEKGILKTYLGTRTPVKGVTRSSGHGRSHPFWPHGLLGGAPPHPGVLIVTAENETAIPTGRVREEFLRTLRDRDLEFGYIVRRIQNESSNPTPSEERQGYGRRGGGNGSLVPPPLEVIRVDAQSGEEIPVRGVRWGRVDARSLRDILMASSGTEGSAAFNMLSRPEGPAGSFGSLATSVICPRAILLDEAEFEPVEGPFTSPPELDHPFFAGGE